MTHEILIAGFGGQGILFAGKFLAYKGLQENRQVSWLPSYGPEMRGGTANCSVILSDDPIGSPIVSAPNVLMVMNLPSLDKYENACVPGGIILLDTTLVTRMPSRSDVRAFGVPATKLAADNGFPTLANMILIGKLIRESGAVAMEDLAEAMKKVVSAKHQDLIDINLKAIDIGYHYGE
ncbi:MAG: 2-oxoacid:acceptor oxidoreductase family protein [Clostridia bacterium]|nr:2-oxoacid:acceptor oxidoreductase family protein [Clostridia bacterium]